MKTIVKHLIPNAGTLIIVGMLFLAQSAGALPSAAPADTLASSQPLISYQGTLTDPLGNPVNGTLPMEFALYDAPTDGTLLWGPENRNVEMSDGLFHVLLGAEVPVDLSSLIGTLYLEVRVNGETLVPREQLASSVVTNLVVSGDSTAFVEGNLQVGYNAWIPAYAGMDGNDVAVLGTLEQYGSGGARVYRLGVGTDPPTGEGQLAASGEIVASGNGTSKIEGNLLVGLNHWVPEYADMDGNDMAVVGTLEQYGQGGTRVYRMGIGTDPGPGEGTLRMGGDLNMNGHSAINCGALTEANLQTEEELYAGRIDRFEEGDVLCWGVDQLEKCSTPNDRLVQAVADAEGRPIVIGAELVRVIGAVKRGDLLVTSDVPGYAMVNNDPVSGSVIGQALEDFDGERGVIKAMIRKW